MPELYETPPGAVASARESRRFETSRGKAIGTDAAWDRARLQRDIAFLQLKATWGYAKLDRDLETFKQAFYLYYAEVFGEPYVPRSYVPKAFDPNQPRVPAGNPDGGQWTRVGGGDGGSAADESASIPPSRYRQGETDQESDRERDLVLLASLSSDGDEPPKVPKKRPARSQTRTRIMRAVGIWLLRETVSKRAATIAQILDQAGWLEPAIDNIRAFTDPPKTLKQLQDDVIDRQREPGYDVHHIVEQTPARRDGFPESMINAPENLVRIPRIKHWAINGWFRVPNESYKGLSPRDYLRKKSWEERRKVGLEALVLFGILKP